MGFKSIYNLSCLSLGINKFVERHLSRKVFIRFKVENVNAVGNRVKPIASRVSLFFAGYSKVVGFSNSLFILASTFQGWCVLQYGTALPDLQALLHIDLDVASWLFTTRSIGYIVGCVISGYFFDRLNRVAIMLIGSIGTAICAFLNPFIARFAMAIVLRAFTGFSHGVIDTGANAIVPSIWGADNGPYMQALYLCYAIGGVIAPVATEPFMATQSYQPHKSSTEPSLIFSDSFNNTLKENVTSVLSNGTSEHFTLSTQVDNLKNAFVIVTIVAFMSCIPYAYMLLKGDYDTGAKTDEGPDERVNVPNKDTDKQRNGETVENVLLPSNIHNNDINTSVKEEQTMNDTESGHGDKSVMLRLAVLEEDKSDKTENKRKDLNICKLYFILACIAMINLIYEATEDTFGSYILTFCIEYMEWDTLHSARISSLYWTSSLVGGVSGIFLVKMLKTTKLLYLTNFVWVFGFIGILIGSAYRCSVVLWVCVPISGFVMVQIIPASISWIEENVCPISGGITSLIMVSTGIGLITNPLFVGYLMQAHSFMFFMYILVAECIACFFFFVAGDICRRRPCCCHTY